MIWGRFSKFERKILGAILLSGLAPFLVWVVLGLRLLLTAPLELPKEAEEKFETALFFYQSFIEAKKAEFGARADLIAQDPLLQNALSRNDFEGAKVRAAAAVEDHASIQAIQIEAPDGRTLVAASGPPARSDGGVVRRTFRLPIGLGDGPILRVIFLEPNDWQTKRDELQDFQERYQASVIDGRQRLTTTFERFALLTAFVLALALLLGLSLTRGVTRRIMRVADATEAVARGNLHVELPIRGNDEVTDLTIAFKRMVEEIGQARDKIVYLEKVSGWQDLAQRLAHEIKNPLTPIQLAMQELERRMPASADPAFRSMVSDSADIIKDEVRALTRLVDEFSQFARLPEAAPERLNLVELVEDFLAAYQGFEAKAEVQCDFPTAPAEVAVDRVLMRQVLNNLVKNAIESAPQGRAHVQLSITCTEAGTDLRISDNGPGVRERDVRRIFEPYFTTKSTGTGLGLAIVKKIVLQHSGNIELITRAPEGAVFVVHLPQPTEIVSSR